MPVFLTCNATTYLSDNQMLDLTAQQQIPRRNWKNHWLQNITALFLNKNGLRKCTWDID